ncbi:MAG: BREX system Lon protease-like protein BrxL [Bacillota bacterium]|nr:MAG: BREX system Lon protease-like protein BrxL [Bacillota bacterium]
MSRRWAMPDPEVDRLITEYFGDVSVDKSISRRIGSGDRVIPDYVSDWLISRYSDQGRVDHQRIAAFLARHLPDRKQKQTLLYELRNGGTLKILDSYAVRVNLEQDCLLLEIPSLDVSNAAVVDGIVDQNPMLLVGNVWGSGTLQRRQHQGETDRYEICMTEFRPMQTSIVDLDYYVRVRKEFSLRQWRELLIRSMGYNPEAYSPREQLHLLTRLCPLVQPRINLIELAPKGTGKSHVFSRLSRHAWLISGGVVSRAQLFYNMATKTAGLITRYDTIVFDEIQTIRFSDEGELVGALKGYLEQGEFRVMQYKGSSDASLVLLANIPLTRESTPKQRDLFRRLPSWIQGPGASALLDRFSGLLPGWELSKVSKESLCSSMALRADYLGEVLHALRLRPEYLDWVKEHTRSAGNIRDITSVERLASAFLRLLFPDLAQVTMEQFHDHCLQPAIELRSRIREQLALIDDEYSPQMAEVAVHF